MKKILTGISAMALVISLSSATAFASGSVRGRNFVDNDNDGICDNYGFNGCGRGAGYVDADGDGICDNFNIGRSQNGSGFRRGHCGGQGRRGR